MACLRESFSSGYVDYITMDMPLLSHDYSQAFRCVFTSPSSARAETAADSLEATELHDDAPDCDQSSPRKSRKTVDSIHTRDHVAGLLKMRSVQPRAIAYIAVQV